VNPELPKRDDETAQEYADRLELAQFLQANHMTGATYVDAKTRQRKAVARQNQKDKLNSIFVAGGALFLVIGVTGWRASPGSRAAALISGGVFLAIQAYRFFKRRRDARNS